MSPFEARHRRVTAKLAEQRNRFVTTLASEAFVTYAGLGTKIEQLCHTLLSSKICVYVSDSTDNAHLIENGAVALQPAQVNALANNVTPFEGG